MLAVLAEAANTSRQTDRQKALQTTRQGLDGDDVGFGVRCCARSQ